MKIKAKISFAGVLTMYKGQEAECGNDAVLQDLLSCGYVEPVETAGKQGGVSESKRSTNKKSG